MPPQPPRSRVRPARWLLAVGLALACAGPRGPESVPERVQDPAVEAGAAFMRGRLLELEGRLLEAVEAYDEAARLDPDSAELQRVLAGARGRLGQADVAIGHAERAFELDPDDELNRRTLAGLYIAAKRYGPATELLEPMFASDALSSDGLLVFLNLHVELGNTDDVRRAARKLLGPERPETIPPPTARTFLAVGKGYERLGETAEADFIYRRGLIEWPHEGSLYDSIAALRRHEEDSEGEIAVLEEKLVAIPDDPTALMRLAQIRDVAEEREESIRLLETLVRAHPDHVNGRLQLGFFYYQENRLKEASEQFERVAAQNPGLHEVRYFLGAVHEEAGDTESAIDALETVPPDSGRFKDARILLARIYDDAERYDEALAEVRRAIAASPEDTSLHVYMAGLQQRGGDLEGAVSTMTGLIDEDPGNPDLYYDLGVLVGEAGFEDRALVWMSRALEADASHSGALNYIGYTWAERGTRLDEAERMIRQALEAKPEDGYITDSLGWVLYKRGLQRLAAGDAESARTDLAGAVRELERAMELTDPDDPVITRHLADAYRSVARPDEALAAYRKALELGPEAEDEADIRLQIELLRVQLEGVTSGVPR